MTIMGQKRAELSIGVGEGYSSAQGDFMLVTFALGSCVGLTLWDPAVRVGGLVHSQLPVSYQNAQRAAENPYLFTDTAVAELLRAVYALGGKRQRIVAKLVGGAERTENSSFRVGQRNVAVARRVLWKNDIVVAAEDVGGDHPRTVYLDMADGRTIVKALGASQEL